MITLVKGISPVSCGGGYLNFSVWSKINLLFETKEIKLYQKRHPMENKTEIMQHVLKMQWVFLFPKYIKIICSGVFAVKMNGR
jgi:hypothetical protein